MKKIQDFFKDSDLSLPEGQMIVLYFYPKDNTSGCTMEAVEFNEYLGVDRSTFVFDEKGILIKEYRNVKPSGHAAQVLKDLKERAL